MKTSILKAAVLCGLFVFGGISGYKAQSYTENFDDVSTLAGNGWFQQNNSSAIGSNPNWIQGVNTPTGPFDAYNGAANAYICANYNSTTGASTISNWLVTPNRTLRNGDVFTFYTRRPTANPTEYPDRLEVRLSTNGASTNVGTGPTAVGDFSTLLLSVNPNLVTGVYPAVWTQFTITISGLSAPTSGRIAFRYFVTNGGPTGTNSDYIGIDNVVYTPYVCPAFTMTPGGALTSGSAGNAYSTSLTQTGALGAPSYAITAGAVPPGVTLSSGGTISGTPTATGTFNFTVTVSDASGCSGSQNYSITVVCPSNPISIGTASTLCTNQGINYTLAEGSPAGGTYSGTGVSGGEFDPASGTQTITYDYTDPYGCAFSSSYTLVVNDPPIVTMSFFAPVCEDAAPVTLTQGSPAGGIYSGIGVNAGEFDPALGSQLITYTYTDANGCSNEDTATFLVHSLPTVTQSTLAAVCADAGAVTLTGGSPAGGTYSGTGVTGTSFNPAAGTQVITYTYTDGNGCANYDTTVMMVNDLPNVTFTSPVSTLCENHAPLTLSGGSPAGGTYSGTGVSGGVLNPATAGAGNHAIVYTYTDPNGCQNDASYTIVVDDCLGLNENTISGLEVYPNPTNGKFVMNVSGVADFSILTVFDIQGKEVRVNTSGLSAQTIEVDLSEQVPGIYFVSGSVDGQRFTIRVQKY
ncbi:choice-of-anchor J domain-containing protein [Fluviicola sp.]|uniref:T9SS-dependent choice-of-anchor J family protein n=1 Tax=Fluviicola sp. TaxID=1917219 RepID=UPI0031E019B9